MWSELRTKVVWVFVALVFACGGDRRPADRDGGVDIDAATDAFMPPDARVDTGPRVDAGRDASLGDSGRDSTIPDSGSDVAAPDGGALDPALSPAGPDGDPCSTPGSLGECPSVEVCRFFDATTSRCESCGPCGNLNDPCSSSAECDIVHVCYAGRCTNFCPLGTFACGPVEACLDVGHPTQGVCDPSTL